MFIFAVTISWKVINIQTSDKWKDERLHNRIKPLEVKATRGNIYASDGSILATSIPEYELRFDAVAPSKKLYDNNILALCDSLAKVFPEEGKDARAFKTMLDNARKSNKRYLRLVKGKIKYHQMKRLENWPIFEQGQLRGGVIFAKTEHRLKPFVLLASKTVGFYENDTSRKNRGIENSFNDFLRGTDGLQYHEREQDGSWRPLNDEETKKTEAGLDVYTTLDINLQDVTEDELMSAMRTNQAAKGCAILMEVETGEIKAMANLKRVVSGGDTTYKEYFNYAVAGRTNPGSTIKIASAMALLEYTDLELNDTIDTGNGVHEFYGVKLRDSHWGGYGKITFAEVIEKSSNIGVAKLVDTIFNKSLADQETFLKFFEDFGLASDLDFQIQGTRVPKIPNLEDPNWSAITIPWMSIGYEAEWTPLHILAFYNGIANNGKMIKPIIVKDIRRANKTIKKFEPEVIQESLCSKETLGKVKTMLEGVVERGTAKNIKTDKYKIAGKTGTSRKLKDGKYVKEYYTSFAGYFPADNPKYSCIVVVDNPQVNKYGSDAAAPVFKAIADYIYANDLNLHETYVCKNNLEEKVFPVIRAGYYDDLLYLCDQLKVPHVKSGNVNGLVRTRLVEENTKVGWKNLITAPQAEGGDHVTRSRVLPDLTDLTVKDVVPLLENMQLRIKYEGPIRGRVASQEPAPGSRVNVGQRVKLSFN